MQLHPPTLARLQEVVVTSSDSLGAPEAAAGGMGLGAFFARQPSAGGSSGRAEVYALKVGWAQKEGTLLTGSAWLHPCAIDPTAVLHCGAALCSLLISTAQTPAGARAQLVQFCTLCAATHCCMPVCPAGPGGGAGAAGGAAPCVARGRERAQEVHL